MTRFRTFAIESLSALSSLDLSLYGQVSNYENGATHAGG